MLSRPDQADRIGQIADIIIREPEQLMIDFAFHQAPYQPGFDSWQVDFIGECRQRPAALWVWHGGKIVCHQRQLPVP